jgi:hypothetical protein
MESARATVENVKPDPVTMYIQMLMEFALNAGKDKTFSAESIQALAHMSGNAASIASELKMLDTRKAVLEGRLEQLREDTEILFSMTLKKNIGKEKC